MFWQMVIQGVAPGEPEVLLREAKTLVCQSQALGTEREKGWMGQGQLSCACYEPLLYRLLWCLKAMLGCTRRMSETGTGALGII